MPFNTRNPIPSGDLRDLDDNARNIDTWANDKTKLSHPDRFGVERRTWHGIEQEAKLNIQQAIDAKNAAQEAAMMSGFSKYADTLAQLEAGIGTDYVDGDVVMVFQDESRGDTSSIFKIESGTAEFKLTFDKTRQDLLSFTGNISADAEWSDVPAHSDLAFDVQAQALANRTEFIKAAIAGLPYSVNTFGASPTASASVNDLAFSAARSAAGSSSVYVKPGVYALTSHVSGDFYSDGPVTISGANIAVRNVAPLLSQRVPPSLPTLGRSKKLILGDASGFYVVTRLAGGRAGYVAMRAGRDVSDADANNVGGASIIRPTQTYKLSTAFAAKTKAHQKSPGVVLSSLTDTQINTMWGFIDNGGSLLVSSDLGGMDFTCASRQVYSLSNVDDFVTYQVGKGKAKVRFGMTNASSDAVLIQVSHNGTAWQDYKNISLQHGPSGTIASKDVEVEFSGSSVWYINVVNKASNAGMAYVVGLNVGELSNDTLIDTDSAVIFTTPEVGGAPSAYQGSSGANEFAARKLGGKWFGTYHGGHSEMVEQLITDLGTYNLVSGQAPKLYVTNSAILQCTSKLTVDSTVYQYSSFTDYGDGANVTTFAIEHISGDPIMCVDIYTHMCTTQRNFNYIRMPKFLQKEDDGTVTVGQCGFIQQSRSADGARINCYFSEVDCTHNGFFGARIDFVPNYNKQYYGPAVGSAGVRLTSGQWVTAKEYL